MESQPQRPAQISLLRRPCQRIIVSRNLLEDIVQLARISISTRAPAVRTDKRRIML